MDLSVIRLLSCTVRFTVRKIPCLAIQVAEFAVLRLDLRGVDFGMMRQNVLPPLLLVQFLKVDVHRFLIL